LWDWRISVLGFLSDQGTERGIRSAPFGAKEEVDAALGALRAGLLHTFEPEAKNIVFSAERVGSSRYTPCLV
jgi:hypothetical protein